jgi:hypothetical protein
MKTGTNEHSSFFYRALAAVAMIGPIFLVFAAGTLPEGGLERGDLIVYGHGVLLAGLATALALRAAYTLAFKSALHNADAALIPFEGTCGGHST